MDCVFLLIAPDGFSIVIEFEEFVLEHEPQCLYDYLAMFEPSLNQLQAENGTARHSHGSHRKNKKSVVIDVISAKTNDHFRSTLQKLINNVEMKIISQPSNITYSIFAPIPNQNYEKLPRKICGDWSLKLKLLRYRTNGNVIGLHFSSDYSHHFSGFNARVSLEKGL